MMSDLFDATLVDPCDDEPVPRCVAVTEGSELVVPHNDPRLIDIEWLSGAVDRVGARKFQRDGRPIGPSHESVFAPMILAAENPNNKTTLVIALTVTCPGSFNVVKVPLVSRRYPWALKFASA